MNFVAARKNMVDCQLRTNKVTDQRVLNAMAEIPREQFVPTALRDIAYSDGNLKIADGRYIMQPMIIARMLQVARIKDDDSVLIVGSASGYMAAVASKLANSVFAVESDAELVRRSESLLTEMAMDNIVIENAALCTGWKKQAPYNVILIDGAIDAMPDDLLKQIGSGGRLVAIVNQNALFGLVTLYKNQFGHVSKTSLFDASAHCLEEFRHSETFAL